MKRDLHTILHTNVCYQWVQKQPKFAKILKNAQNLNSKPVLESVLVTDSKTVLRFSCLAPEVQLWTVMESVTKNNSKTGFEFKYWAIKKITK